MLTAASARTCQRTQTTSFTSLPKQTPIFSRACHIVGEQEVLFVACHAFRCCALQSSSSSFGFLESLPLMALSSLFALPLGRKQSFLLESKHSTTSNQCHSISALRYAVLKGALLGKLTVKTRMLTDDRKARLDVEPIESLT